MMGLDTKEELSPEYTRKLERNLRKYAWAKILIMRVYYPVLGVYMVSVGHMSLVEIALVGSIAAAVQFVLQIPSGYWADKYGTERILKIGSLISLTGPLWYLFFPGFFGALIGLVLFYIGCSVLIGSGTIESLFHDTLVKLGRARSYAKQIGRAQSYGLVGNVILVLLVPLTYEIWWGLPFVIGFVAQIGLHFLIRSFEYPDLPRSHTQKHPLDALKKIVKFRTVAIFLFAGFFASLGWASGTGEYFQIRIEDLGLAVGLFGIVQAGGSLVGALLGLVIHKFEKLSIQVYSLVDMTVAVLSLATIGLAPNMFVAAGAGIVFMGWIRVQKIPYQALLLHELKHDYKASLISAFAIFTNGASMISPMLLAFAVGLAGGLAPGYVLFAGIALVIGMFLWGFIWLTVRRQPA